MGKHLMAGVMGVSYHNSGMVETPLSLSDNLGIYTILKEVSV
jgi:hypothetical protein